MIGRVVEAVTAAAKLATAQEDAAVRLRELAQQYAKTGAAEARVVELEAQVVGLNEEARDRGREAQKLRAERDALADALEKSRQIAAGRAADIAELQRELRRVRPPGADPVTAPRGDLGEVERLRGELARLKQFAAAQENRLALAEGRDIQGTVVGDGRTG